MDAKVLAAEATAAGPTDSVCRQQARHAQQKRGHREHGQDPQVAERTLAMSMERRESMEERCRSRLGRPSRLRTTRALQGRHAYAQGCGHTQVTTVPKGFSSAASQPNNILLS